MPKIYTIQYVKESMYKYMFCFRFWHYCNTINTCEKLFASHNHHDSQFFISRKTGDCIKEAKTAILVSHLKNNIMVHFRSWHQLPTWPTASNLQESPLLILYVPCLLLSLQFWRRATSDFLTENGTF